MVFNQPEQSHRKPAPFAGVIPYTSNGITRKGCLQRYTAPIMIPGYWSCNMLRNGNPKYTNDENRRKTQDYLSDELRMCFALNACNLTHL